MARTTAAGAGLLAASVVFLGLARPLLLAQFGPEALLVGYALVSVIIGSAVYLLSRRISEGVRRRQERAPAGDDPAEDRAESADADALDESLVESEMQQLRNE